MPLELNITAEDVEALVRDSIMKSGFGKAVEEGVKKAFSGYDNPIDKEIKSYVAEVCRKLLREKFSTEVLAAVTKAIQEKVTQELIDKTVAAATERMVRAADESRY